MDNNYDLSRFLEAQENTYSKALVELRNGKKETHWMWFIFPQIIGLGLSPTSKFYAIKDIKEADLFLHHPILGKRLIEISSVLLELKDLTARDIFGQPDDSKLQSCMTLFTSLEDTNAVFSDVIERYYNGKKDEYTLEILGIL